MKKTLLLIVTIVLGITTVFAQQREGFVEYEMEVSGDSPQAQQAAQMLQGSSLKTYYSPENVLSEMSMGMFMTQKSYYTVKDSSLLMLMSGMMGKKAIKMTAEDLREKQAESEIDSSDYEVVATDEEKEILGYTCKKYILKYNGEQNVEMNYWTTTEIDVNKENIQQMSSMITGFPLEFDVNQRGMLMTFTAIDIAENLDDFDKADLFSQEIPEGYEEMTIEELQKMGMGK